jgi:hypothetical protein
MSRNLRSTDPNRAEAWTPHVDLTAGQARSCTLTARLRAVLARRAPGPAIQPEGLWPRGKRQVAHSRATRSPRTVATRTSPPARARDAVGSLKSGSGATLEARRRLKRGGLPTDGSGWTWSNSERSTHEAWHRRGKCPGTAKVRGLWDSAECGPSASMATSDFLPRPAVGSLRWSARSHQQEGGGESPLFAPVLRTLFLSRSMISPPNPPLPREYLNNPTTNPYHHPKQSAHQPPPPNSHAPCTTPPLPPPPRPPPPPPPPCPGLPRRILRLTDRFRRRRSAQLNMLGS